MMSRLSSICGRLGLALALFSIVGCGGAKGRVADHYDSSTNGNLPDGWVPPPDARAPTNGRISGTVWMPGNAPGMVPAGHEIPVYEALVYLSASKPPPIDRMVHCEQCVDPPSLHALADHKGRFELTNVYQGNYWLVIQKGQFRLSQQITLAEDQQLELSADQTTLPSVQDYDSGKEIPAIALASGFWDHMEQILNKMGITDFDVYANDGDIDYMAVADLEQLVENYANMQQYHIIFVPCSTQTYGGSGLSGAPTQVLQNLRDFVSDGGKLYVTDWSGEYEDNVFPEQIRFDNSIDTPPGAWDGTNWNPSLFGDADGFSSYYSNHAYAVDPDLNAWLHDQQGPLINPNGGYGSGVYDANNFVVEGKYSFIEEVITVQIGFENEVPVLDIPHVFVIGDEGGTPSTCAGTGEGCSPLTLTFEPVGCGRVLYSSYHTTEDEHDGLVPQERVLAYLIMEIGVCKSGPIVE